MTKIKNAARNPFVLVLFVVSTFVVLGISAQRILAQATSESIIDSGFAEGDAAFAAGDYATALALYLETMDYADSVDSPQTMQSHMQVLMIGGAISNGMPEEEIDAIEAALPEWDSLTSVLPKACEMWFYSKRLDLCEAAGDEEGMLHYAGILQDVAWGLLNEHPMDLIAVDAIHPYEKACTILGEEELAGKNLREYVDTMPPSAISFSLLFGFAEGADAEADVDSLKQYCQRMMDIYDAGILTPSLEDPNVGDWSKLIADYGVAYACFLLNRQQDALAQCNHIIDAYSAVKEDDGREAGIVTSAHFVKAMATAQLNVGNVPAAVAAYEQFIQGHPDHPDSARAMVNQALTYERSGMANQAEERYTKAATDYPETDAAREAADALAQRYGIHIEIDPIPEPESAPIE